MAINLERFISNACCNSCQSFYDHYVEANVRFRSRLGMKAVIIRRQLGHCCDWCASLAGIYDPSNAPDDIYKRHENCRCLVTSKTEKGYQDVWNKKIYQTQREARLSKLNQINAEINLNSEIINSEHFSKLTKQIDKNWRTIQNTILKSKEEGMKMLEELGFDNKYLVVSLNNKQRNLSGTNYVIFTRDNLAYCLYKHKNQFHDPIVFRKIPDVITNYDYFKIGKSGKNDDFNFLKLYSDKNIGMYALEIKMNRVKNSEEYIVHFMQVRKNKLNNILKKYR